MKPNDYFYDSVIDGISIAINEFDQTIECSNQDSYELLVETFGIKLNSHDLENVTQAQLEKLAQNMKEYFELSYLPSSDNIKKIINYALMQWNG